MANPQRGEVAIEADGKTYTLVLDVNAMCECEDLLSTPDRQVTFPEVLQGVLRNNIRMIRAFTWAALRRYHKEMTLAQAGQLITDAGGLEGFAAQIEKLAASTEPDSADKALKSDDGRPTAARARKRAGTGGNSTSKLARSA